jgi:mannose-6-phosphate isomerase-like protein (cupin superfamily)
VAQTEKTFRFPLEDMQAEGGDSAFSALLHVEGDEVRRNVFTMVTPEQSASGRITAGYTTIFPLCGTRGHEHGDREEVYFFTRGRGLMVVNDKETEVAAGDTFYLEPGPFHITRNTTDLPLEYFWITIRV